MKKVWCFDIDGTLADISHRLHYIQGEKKDWNAFFAAVVDDAPILPAIQMAHMIAYKYPIVFLSGRRESCREDTKAWLESVAGFYNVHLFMRPNGDYRPDTQVKAEMLETMKLEDMEPYAIVEDRKCMVDMWRSKGIFVFDVNQSGKDY